MFGLFFVGHTFHLQAESNMKYLNRKVHLLLMQIEVVNQRELAMLTSFERPSLRQLKRLATTGALDRKRIREMHNALCSSLKERTVVINKALRVLPTALIDFIVCDLADENMWRCMFQICMKTFSSVSSGTLNVYRTSLPAYWTTRPTFEILDIACVGDCSMFLFTSILKVQRFVMFQPCLSLNGHMYFYGMHANAMELKALMDIALDSVAFTCVKRNSPEDDVSVDDVALPPASAKRSKTCNDRRLLF